MKHDPSVRPGDTFAPFQNPFQDGSPRINQDINFLGISDPMTQGVGMSASRPRHLHGISQIDSQSPKGFGFSWMSPTEAFLKSSKALRRIVQIQIQGRISQGQRIVRIGRIGLEEQYLSLVLWSDRRCRCCHRLVRCFVPGSCQHPVVDGELIPGVVGSVFVFLDTPIDRSMQLF